MLISRRRRFVYAAFNKTASTSIEQALAPYGSRWARWRLRRRYARLKLPVVFKHARPVVLRDLLGEETWRSSFTFAFVRNPFDRLVSVYNYHREAKPREHPLASQLEFPEWVLAGGSGSMSRLMSEFVCDDDGNQVLDFVGRFEHLERDFAQVCARIGLSASLPRRNVSRHDHYSTYYSEAARREVERRFQRDLDMFGYTFEHP